MQISKTLFEICPLESRLRFRTTFFVVLSILFSPPPLGGADCREGASFLSLSLVGTLTCDGCPDFICSARDVDQREREREERRKAKQASSFFLSLISDNASASPRPGSEKRKQISKRGGELFALAARGDILIFCSVRRGGGGGAKVKFHCPCLSVRVRISVGVRKKKNLKEGEGRPSLSPKLIPSPSEGSPLWRNLM